MKQLARVLLILQPLLAVAGEPGPPFERPDALLLNVTESDLNRIVAGSFHGNGGPDFEGTKAKVSKAVAELNYHAKLSEPHLALGDGGKAALTFDIREASLRIGRLERKIAGRWASCENAGVHLDPARPLAVTMGLDFRIEDGDLRIVPDSVSVPDAENRLSFVKPSRCTNAPLPRWLLWWIGKPSLKRYLGNLDEILLARARKSAARIEEKRVFLRKSWEVSEGEELHLYPAGLDTGRGSLFVSLTASSTPPGPGPSATPVPGGLPVDRSFLALSETFTNEVLQRTVSRMSVERLRPTGSLQKLVRSGSIYALIPGLRGLETTDTLLYSIVFRSAPRVLFRKSAGSGATIHLLLSNIELRLYKEHAGGTALLGTLEVESGSLSVLPFRSVLGGVSFRILENEWTVSSKGIRFDDALVSATLQELTFGRIFETTYQPLGANSLHVGKTGFAPRSFEAVGDYLVIELGAAETGPEERAVLTPMRTDNLPSSR